MRRRRPPSLRQTPALTAGIVLAGGRSSRFGATDKLMVEVAGQPLLHHAVLRLAEVVDDVVVVLAPGADVTGLPPGIRTAHDPADGEGPLAGLHAGLVAVPRAERAIAAGGDMPDLHPPVLRELLRVLDEAEVDAAALDDAGRLRPLPASLRVGPATEAAHALLDAGHRRLRDLFGALRTAVVDEATWTALDPERQTLRDVDEPADLTD